MTKGIRLYTEIDEELNVWFDKCERDGWTIMDYMIQREAKTIYRRQNNIPKEWLTQNLKLPIAGLMSLGRNAVL